METMKKTVMTTSVTAAAIRELPSISCNCDFFFLMYLHQANLPNSIKLNFPKTLIKNEKSVILKKKESDWVGHIVFQSLTLTSTETKMILN